MRDVAEILEHWQADRSIRAIGSSLGADRDTVRKYVRAAQAQGYRPGPDGGPAQGWRVWVAENFPAVTEWGRWAPTWKELEGFREEIIAGLKETCAATVWQRLREEQGLRASYNSFRRYVKRRLPGTGKERRIRVLREDPPPGEEAQVDFGHLGLWRDPVTGKGRRVWVFAMELSHSRYSYARVFLTQGQRAWQEGHIKAMEFYGGVPQRRVLGCQIEIT